MEKEFVPYEQVSSLIALGFNEPVIAHRQHGLDICLLKQPKVLLSDLSMILYQQAFRWFREKYNLHSFIDCKWKNTGWEYELVDLNKMEKISCIGNYGYKTPEEAELACLKRLIEIVEQKEK
jgi:hypothetical protein